MSSIKYRTAGRTVASLQLTRRAVMAMALLAGCAASASAQVEDDPASRARVKVGPLALTPSIAIRNFGVDSNVFNEPENPKRDFTATFSPEVAFWLGKGRARLSGASRMETIYFKEYSQESSVNTVNAARFELLLNRLKPYVAGLMMAVTERPDLEIDTRARRRQHSLEAGLMIRATAKTWFKVAEVQEDVAFDSGATFEGADLRESLSRQRRAHRVGVEYAMTPLTTFILDVDREETSFRFSPERNASGLRVTPGFTFKPHALFSGGLRVGLLKYSPTDPVAANYTGPTAAVDLSYRGIGDTEVVGAVQRDLFYSADVQMYYLQTGVSLGLTRYLTPQWSVRGGASMTWLSYSPATPLPAGAAPPPTRPDRVVNLSLSVDRRIAGAHVGFAAVLARRDSTLQSGRYDNLRLVGTVSYGAR